MEAATVVTLIFDLVVFCYPDVNSRMHKTVHCSVFVVNL